MWDILILLAMALLLGTLPERLGQSVIVGYDLGPPVCRFLRQLAKQQELPVLAVRRQDWLRMVFIRPKYGPNERQLGHILLHREYS